MVEKNLTLNYLKGLKMPHLIGFALLIVVGFMVPPLGILMLAIVLLGAD